MSIDTEVRVEPDDPRVLNWLASGGAGSLPLEKDKDFFDDLGLEYCVNSERTFSATITKITYWTVNVRYYLLVRRNPNNNQEQKIQDVEIPFPLRHSLEFELKHKLYVAQGLSAGAKKLAVDKYSSYSQQDGDPFTYLENFLSSAEAHTAGITRNSIKIVVFPVLSQKGLPKRLEKRYKEIEELYRTGPIGFGDNEYFRRNNIFLKYLREESGFSISDGNLNDKDYYETCNGPKCPPYTKTEREIEEELKEKVKKELPCDGDYKLIKKSSKIGSYTEYKSEKKRVGVGWIDCILAVIFGDVMYERKVTTFLDFTCLVSKDTLDKTLLSLIEKCLSDVITPRLIALTITNLKAGLIAFSAAMIDCLTKKGAEELTCLKPDLVKRVEYAEWKES